MIFRPATTADIPRAAGLIVPDPASPLTAEDYHSRLGTGEYRPDRTWVAEGDGGIQALAVWWGRPGDPAPDALDALFTSGAIPGDQRVAVAGGLLAAAHDAFSRSFSRTTPAFHLILPPDWRSRRDVIPALSWRWQAALRAGLTVELERLSFEWRAGTGTGGTNTGGTSARLPGMASDRLVFRREPDDEVFAGLFRRTLAGTLDATTRAMADAVGGDEQARADVAFYRDRMFGDRAWWLVAHTHAGEPVGFGIPSRNNDVPVVGYIGVLPEHRGHGYIDDILAETTRVLVAEAHATVIRADTDLANRPMAAAFERAGYRNYARRVVLSAPL
jgi:RimJ/RimL family protein N-acetyltransferase